jgi:hypothetical protein
VCVFVKVSIRVSHRAHQRARLVLPLLGGLGGEGVVEPFTGAVTVEGDEVASSSASDSSGGLNIDTGSTHGSHMGITAATSKG